MAWTKTSQRKPARPKRAKRSAKQDPIAQPFMQHIYELRKRLFWTVLVGLALGTVVYSYHDFFLHLIMSPLGNEKLIYLTPAGGFAFIFSATMYVTAIGVLPFFLYQIYGFLRPAIPAHTNKLSIKMAFAALLLMSAGVTFGYVVAVPSGLQFLTTFASDYVVPSLTAESYLNFVFGYVLGIGLLFELPLVLLLVHWVYPLTMKQLLNSERFVIVLAFILAAIISPTPDALNQAMIAVPIIVVYQLGVIAVWISIRKKNKLAKKAAAKTQAPPPTAPKDPPKPPLSRPQQPVPVVQTVPVVPQPRPVRPAASTSIDGFRPQKRTLATSQMHAQFEPMHHNIRPPVQVPQSTKASSQQPPAKRGQIVVPGRNSGLISDFGPIRRSAIDISR